MSTPNDVTILRFYKDDNPSPTLSVNTLGPIEYGLTNVACAIPSMYGVTMNGGEIRIAAAPRQGCLEILIVPQLWGAELADIAKVSSEGADLIRQGVERYGDLTMFLWTLTFGGCGLLDLWNRATRKGDLSGPAPAPSTEEQHIIYKLSSGAIRKDTVISGLRQLTDVARATGMDKVTIEVTDGPELELYANTIRQRRGLIASRSRQTPPAVDSAPQTTQITRNEEPLMDVIVGSDRLKAFAGGEGGARRMIVWKSKHDIPAWKTVEVRGIYIDPLTIEPLEEVPEELENLDGAFLVQGVIILE